MTHQKQIKAQSISYHGNLLKNLADSNVSSDCESTVLLKSGKQQLLVHAALLRNASSFLKEILPIPCSCSSPQMMILLPPTPSLTLACLVQLLFQGILPSVSRDVAKAVLILAKELGIERIVETKACDKNDAGELAQQDESEVVDTRCDESKSDSSGLGLLKLKTDVNFNGKSVCLQLPKSRLGRNIRKHVENPCEEFKSDHFKQRIQKEYNMHSVGQYMGPYDQDENLMLSAQLPKCGLNFKTYTEFSHDDEECYSFKTEHYDSFDVLEKIDSYQIESKAEKISNKSDGDIYYTCQHRKCKIPCPCAHCCSDTVQCAEHKLCHPALFDSRTHAVSIRSSDTFCKDQSFFDNSYIIKYPGIPLSCKKCERDLSNHDCYHFEYHSNCRYCSPTFFKSKASTEKELRVLIKDEAEYFRTVCQYCDRRFCEAYFVKKHIETEHGEKPFECLFCSKRFQSDKAKCYHERTVHCDPGKLISCERCNLKFKAEVHLLEHEKYVHSEVRKWSCTDCNSQFKQRKNLRAHMLKVHNEDHIREDYQEKPELVEEYKCKECISIFKYKKNLDAHVRNKHASKLSFPCDDCESTFSNKKTLVAHSKGKHGPKIINYDCPLCGKVFSEKRSLKRHEKTHYSTLSE